MTMLTGLLRGRTVDNDQRKEEVVDNNLSSREMVK